MAWFSKEFKKLIYFIDAETVQTQREAVKFNLKLQSVSGSCSYKPSKTATIAEEKQEKMQ